MESHTFELNNDENAKVKNQMEKKETDTHSPNKFVCNQRAIAKNITSCGLFKVTYNKYIHYKHISFC